MVSRNRYGRYDVEARDADAPSPWSDDQATTSYFAGHLRAVPGGAPGVPPLPERFAETDVASDGGFDDEPTQWRDERVSWDATPPMASGVARRQPMAADHPRPGLAAYADALEEPEDWTAELEAYAQVPAELEPVTQAQVQDPYAWEPTTAYVPAELSGDNPWEDEPNLHAGELSQLYAADPGAWELAPEAYDPQPTAAPATRTQRRLSQPAAAPASSPRAQSAAAPSARTQRQRPVPRQASSPRMQSAVVPSARQRAASPHLPAPSASSPSATGPRRAVTSSPDLAPARRTQDTRALSRSVQPTQRHRPVVMAVPALDAALDDNPFAKPRRARGSWLLSSVVSCGVVAALYFSGSVARLSGMLQADQAPVLRSKALPSAAPAVPPPPAAAPAPAEPAVEPAAEPVREPVGHARSGSARKRTGGDDDLGTATKKRTTASDELASVDEPTQKPAPRKHVAELDADSEELAPPARPAAQEVASGAPEARATLRINSRPWSQVFVDGKLVGNTPQLALQVSAGHHDIRLANPELEVSKTFQLDARPGETVSRVELLTD